MESEKIDWEKLGRCIRFVIERYGLNKGHELALNGLIVDVRNDYNAPQESHAFKVIWDKMMPPGEVIPTAVGIQVYNEVLQQFKERLRKATDDLVLFPKISRGLATGFQGTMNVVDDVESCLVNLRMRCAEGVHE